MKEGSRTARCASRLLLDVSQHEGVGVVRCRGRICFREEAVQFSRTVIDLMLAGHNVVLDFSGVELLDSAGLGELVLVHMQSQATGIPVCLVAPIPRVHSLLQLTNVASLFTIYPTVEDAKASLTSHAA